MTAANYLIDTSALARLLKAPLRGKWAECVELGLIARCPVTDLEFLYSAKSVKDREENLDDINLLTTWVPVDDRAYTRAEQVQELLTKKGEPHSAGPVDLIVAATAELGGLEVLHYDRGFETIAEITKQPTQWLAEPGSLN